MQVEEVKLEELKFVDTIEELNTAAKELLGKKLVTHQTGPEGTRS